MKYLINIDATYLYAHEVEATSKDAIWKENPELEKLVDELTSKLYNDHYMVVEVDIEEAE
jgi:hypothetical protein|tara:strand:+ start:36708 stop:36887 length:180 start_codon:yes stop_codon:yes gene_type:complete